MKYTVTFSANVSGEWVVDHMRERGLHALDAARASLGPHINELRYYPMRGQHQLIYKLDEARARRASDVFAHEDSVTVSVPPEALNQYASFTYWDDHGVGVQVLDIDSDRLVEDWIAAGAPLEWAPEGTTFGTAEEADNQ
jgi:hypothetical protein